MAGGINLALSELIAEWIASNPEAKYKDWLEIIDQLSATYEFKETELPRDFQNKPLSGHVVIKRLQGEPKIILQTM